MAKGNIFLGMGRGSVGDVTFYRGNGQQLSRVRNRKPKNPRTAAQLYQRAIMATVVKAYQAGKKIFDHSFQGVRVGADNMRTFISLNAKSLRDVVANDINNAVQVDMQSGRVVAPGTNSPVPWSYIVSRGSYVQNLFSWDTGLNAMVLSGYDLEDTVSSFAAKAGLIAGDIYTFVVFTMSEDSVYTPNFTDSSYAIQYQTWFRFLRLTVKDNLSSDTTPLTKFSQLFDITTDGQSYNFTPDNKTIIQNFQISDFTPLSYQGMISGSIGVIRSRLDADLRSDTEMIMYFGTQYAGKFGIASDYILDVWGDTGNTIGNSSLILEGGDV